MQSKDALKKELMSLERQYWSAIKNKDASKAVSLSDDPCVVVGAQGVGEVGNEELSGMVKGAPVRAPGNSLSTMSTFAR